VTRRVHDVPAPPFYQRFRRFETNLDRWFIYDFVLPGTLLMHSGGRPVGASGDDMRNAVQLHSCQTLTPETATSTHYFFQQSHRAGEGDERIVQSIYDSLVGAFNEGPRHDLGAGPQHRAQPEFEDAARSASIRRWCSSAGWSTARSRPKASV
jgi:vanillate O-demethylase monooxygenase subunit